MNQGFFGIVPGNAQGGFKGFPDVLTKNNELARGMYGFQRAKSVPIEWNTGKTNEFPYVVPNDKLSLTGFAGMSLYARGSGDNALTIDYGDGYIVTYPFSKGFTLGHRGANNVNGNVDLHIPIREYPDGLLVERKVVLKIDNPADVWFVNWNNTMLTGAMPVGIKEFYNLNQLQVTYMRPPMMNSITEEVLNLPKLTTIVLNSAFEGPLMDKIPLSFFSKPLTRFTYSGNFGNKAFSATNMDKIALLKDTLDYIAFGYSSLSDNNAGEGGLPANFNQLHMLRQIHLGENQFTTVPAVVNEIPYLTHIFFAYGRTIENYGDFSNQVNLFYINATNALKIPAQFPTYFSNFTKLRQLSYQDIFIAENPRDANDINLFIDSLYSLTTQYGSMVNNNSLPFRSMIIWLTASAGYNSHIPTGTYQQPAGYVPGSFNGTPVSSQEKIWVMVNQYKHTWTYKQS